MKFKKLLMGDKAKAFMIHTGQLLPIPQKDYEEYISK